jgi:tRNA (mo5U34)-methyltransferase
VKVDEDLRTEGAALGPWHLEVELDSGLTTAAFRRPEDIAADVSFMSPHEGFLQTLERIYPEGLEGRSVLDCACNCGAYLFWARERGAGRCFGFDARDLWIRQARFLKAHRAGAVEIDFEIADLYDLDSFQPELFDVTLFNGIFYHLPDPIRGLKLAADRTRELLVLNTATKAGAADGALHVSREPIEHPMSGIHGLNWLPGGPRVLAEVLAYLGFPETRVNWWAPSPEQLPGLERVELIAARSAEALAAYDSNAGPHWRELVRNYIPPGATVLIARRRSADGFPPDDEALKLHARWAAHFPRVELLSADAGEEAELVEDLELSGCGFVVFRQASRWWLDCYPGLERYLRERYPVAVEEDGGCVIFDLR